MNVNFSSNSHPVVSQYDSHARLAPVDTAEDRRVIFIYDGVLTLNPSAYLAERLYQAFLLYNHKLFLCECFSEESVLDYCLQHMIQAWCLAMEVEFIAEDASANQSRASLAEVAQATAKWLAVYAEKSLSLPVSQCGVGKGNKSVKGASSPGDVLTSPSSTSLVAPTEKAADTLSVVSGAGKRRYSSKSKPPSGDGHKRKADTAKTKSVGSKKPRSKSRKPAPCNKDRAVRLHDEQMLPKVQEGQVTTTPLKNDETWVDVRPTVGLEPYDVSCSDSLDQMSEDDCKLLLTLHDSIDLTGCDDSTETAVVSHPHAAQDDTRPLLSTTTDKRIATTDQQQHKHSESTVEGFHEEQSPVFATSDEEEQADKVLMNIPLLMSDAAASSKKSDDDDLSLDLEPPTPMSEEEFWSMDWI